MTYVFAVEGDVQAFFGLWVLKLQACGQGFPDEREECFSCNQVVVHTGDHHVRRHLESLAHRRSFGGSVHPERTSAEEIRHAVYET